VKVGLATTLAITEDEIDEIVRRVELATASL
jgi:hypothetical protein